MRIFDGCKENVVGSSISPQAGGQAYKIGDRIGGRYEIHRILGGEGKSGMGIVYVCYDHEIKLSLP